MNNDLTILASAYLDGETSPAERAQVDGDAELIAEVERLRQVRAVLGSTNDGDEAPISLRERHLAAALDTWDRLPDAERAGQRDITPAGVDGAAAAGAASVTAPTALSNRRKRKDERANTGWLLTAAAGLVLVLGGGLVAKGLVDRGESDESVSESSADTGEAADERLSVQAQLEADAADETFADDSSGAAAEPSLAIVADEAPAEASTYAERALEDGPSPEDGLATLSSNETLRVFASAALPDRPSADSAAEVSQDVADTSAAEAAAPTTIVAIEPAFSDCNGLVDIIVGPAFWDSNGGLFAEEFVIVGIDLRRNEAVAYREEDCTEVARTSLDSP